ncbi:arsenic transporter [Paenibacillus alginolyticus]|uniref:Arsenic transporter n=1 Tax=Paenibacillus alginolyticus TaxID=59839 RepID=A0ABT4GP59_9BACL|nr:arsenic transporter [Paenibacillus alginolyticus]MCY9665925.1 arsenic transporter [Paenibacillus alginolyticus]MCY9697915.1 arsenic transporter [Paenibacillus alginolyticus]MEC0145684.1 arsenic transporter [Paenibacillus alginolyticus]
MIGSSMVTLTIAAFLMTVILILWRPKELNEAIPAIGGAILVILSGSVSFADLLKITNTISDAAITIMATIVMAIVLESFGFFQWAAEGLMARAKGSGIRLFWYVNLLCFLMTLFFNNDGSIMITTPILIIVLQNLGLKNHQKIPYLLSGALIATASSAPIGVSNIVNLIALKIVGMNLYMHTLMMFIPSTLGLIVFLLLLFLCFYRILPKKLPLNAIVSGKHPLHVDLPKSMPVIKNRAKFMRNILLFVFMVRVSLFAASYMNIPVSLMAVIGSIILLTWRWIYLKISPIDMVKKTPWHILVFAFGMYVIIYGLNNIGLTHMLVNFLKPLASGDLLNGSLLMGGLVTVLSTLVNNHPALMIGTLTLTGIGLDPLTLKVTYLASVVGSDLGSLLLPIGTLASLIWLHILRQHKVKISWKDYCKVTFVTIPPALIFTLVCLSFWVKWIF